MDSLLDGDGVAGFFGAFFLSHCRHCALSLSPVFFHFISGGV